MTRTTFSFRCTLSASWDSPTQHKPGPSLDRGLNLPGLDDADGNLYVTRHGKGTVVVLSPAGKVLREVGVLGSSPSNLCFGGPDGRTVYVTEVEKRRLVRFRVDRPGLAWRRWQEK